MKSTNESEELLGASEYVKLGKYCTVDSGYAFKSESFTDDTDAICLVKGSNLGHRSINWKTGPRWPVARSEGLDRYELVPGDVVLAMDRPIVGDKLKYASIGRKDPKSYVVQRVARLRSKDVLLRQQYLNQVVASPAFQIYIDTITTGVNVPHISGPDIRKFRFFLPSTEAQEKIAAILSAYDDLIENNQRRIQLLEELAQQTYEQWFVRLKFPGHANCEIDETTKYPIDWIERPVADFCEKITDGTHDSPEQVSDGIPLVTGKDIGGGFIRFENAYLISDTDHQAIKRRSGVAEWDILFSNIGTLGNVGVVTQDFDFSCKNVIIFKRKIGFEHFLYCYISNRHTLGRLDSQSSGVAQKFYSLKFVRSLKERLPPDELIQKFSDWAKPVMELKRLLSQQNAQLTEARDILLPRLMTGLIDINEVEVPAALLQRLNKVSAKD